MQKVNKNSNIYIIVILFLISFFINVNSVLAANINFSPTSSTYHVGDTIRIKINISSDKMANATSASVSFPSNILTLTSLSKSSSIISLWAQEPTFSNNSGIANFEGVILNGYTGTAGNIITLVFKAKDVGQATLKFSNVTILANDGQGTNIFSGELPQAFVNIQKAIKVEEPQQEIKQEPKIEEATKVVENAVEKIKEVEISNKLPNNSLLITIIILLIILLNLIVIFAFYLFSRLKKRVNNKLVKAEIIIDSNFKKLEENINSEIVDSKDSKNAKINVEQADNVLEDIKNIEGKIIKEVEEIKEKI